MSEPTIRYADIDGLRLRYEVTGPDNGDPLILMHGWGCRLETVRSIAQTASLTHRVYNLDLPGFGESDEPDSTWGVEEYTRAVEKFASGLGIVRPVLIGHSFGGRISILYGSRNEVTKIVLVDSAGIKPRRPLKYYVKVHAFKTAKWIANHTMSRQAAERRIERMRARRGSADYSSSSPRMRAVLSKVVNEDLSDRLTLVGAPTLLVWGERDTATPLSDAHKMDRLLKDSGLVVFEGAGHYSFLDCPGRFAAVLGSFLTS